MLGRKIGEDLGRVGERREYDQNQIILYEILKEYSKTVLKYIKLFSKIT